MNERTQNITNILEGLNRVNEVRKRKLSELILLRAAYNKDLHDAISKGNKKAFDKWIKDYKSDKDNAEELSWYEDEKIDIKKLKKELDIQDDEFKTAHLNGRDLFGEGVELLSDNKSKIERLFQRYDKDIKCLGDSKLKGSYVYKLVDTSPGVDSGKNIYKFTLGVIDGIASSIDILRNSGLKSDKFKLLDGKSLKDIIQKAVDYIISMRNKNMTPVAEDALCKIDESDNQKVIKLLKSLKFGQEVENKIVGDWSIDVWSENMRYGKVYIIQVENNRTGAEINIPDIQSEDDFNRVIRNIIKKLS